MEPTKRNAEWDQKVFETLRAGNTLEVAAADAGYSKTALYRHLYEYPMFCNKSVLLKTEAEAAALALVMKAAAQWNLKSGEANC